MSTKRGDDVQGYSRRGFLKKFSMGMGAAWAMPSLYSWGAGEAQPDKYYQQWRRMRERPEEEKLGIALVGLGSYSTYQLAPALQETKLCKLSGVVTGTPAKEKRWASKYGIPESNIYNYKTYDRIADNPDIDIIYVVLPNGMHAEYTIRASEAGKHVICEKPMATSVADAQAMVDACRKAGKKLSIGYRLHFEPYNQEMMRLGQQEVFGTVRSLASGNGFRMGGDRPDRWRLDKELAGGGPLMDMGIYSVQGKIYTLGKAPLSVTAHEPPKKRPGLFDEVEESIRWELEFPGGLTGKGESTYDTGMSYLHADAANGWFNLDTAFYYEGQNLETSRGEVQFPQVREQTLQMDAFADCIFSDRQSRVPGEMGVRDMKILMAIYESARTGNRVDLDLEDAFIDRYE